MAKNAKDFFEQLQGAEQPGLIESVKEAVFPLKDIGGQLWDSLKPMFDHGRTEAAAALFSGHGHVMYMHGQEGVEQGQDQVQQSPDVQQEQDRGGMSM